VASSPQQYPTQSRFSAGNIRPLKFGGSLPRLAKSDTRPRLRHAASVADQQRLHDQNAQPAGPRFALARGIGGEESIDFVGGGGDGIAFGSVEPDLRELLQARLPCPADGVFHGCSR